MPEDIVRGIFAKRLKFMMNLKGIKQTDIVRDLGLNSSTVSNWCNGIMMPRTDKLKMLADYLGCSVADLVEDKSEEIIQEQKELHYLNTLAAHLEGEVLTDEDLKDIENFIEFIKSRNK